MITPPVGPLDQERINLNGLKRMVFNQEELDHTDIDSSYWEMV